MQFIFLCGFFCPEQLSLKLTPRKFMGQKKEEATTATKLMLRPKSEPRAPLTDRGSFPCLPAASWRLFTRGALPVRRPREVGDWAVERRGAGWKPRAKPLRKAEGKQQVSVAVDSGGLGEAEWVGRGCPSIITGGRTCT